MHRYTRQVALFSLWASPFLFLILLLSIGPAASNTEAPSPTPVLTVPAPTVSPGLPIFAPPTAKVSHPSLFFNDISECPGYALNSKDPWHSCQEDILSAAQKDLSWDFSRSVMGNGYDSIMYRGTAAQELGLAYQITKDPKYSAKAKEALMNIGTGDIENNLRKAMGLFGYSIAYDLVQPTLSPREDAAIRDKLALLADGVYNDLNDNGTSRDYVTFHDYHGRAYMAVAMAGLALSDYSNPNHLSLSSTPDDLVRCGTYYFWVNDDLHDFNRSLASWAIENSTGKDYVGYNAYTDEGIILFAQAYSHVYGRNYFDEYPLAKKHFLVEIWTGLPDYYSANFETISNVLWMYEPGIFSLLDPDNLSYALNRYDQVRASKSLLQYPSVEGGASETTIYLTMRDYSSVPRKFPPATSYLNKDSVFQVFRQSWSKDSEWLSLRTFYPMEISNNRVQAREDQLGFEYYGKGDLLLADACEDKYVLDKYYAMYENYHNVIAIEDPRKPFSVSDWADSPARGIYKGASGKGITTPASIEYIARTPWMEALGAYTDVRQVPGNSWTSRMALSSDIGYRRDVLFPEKDYFIIVDRFEGKQDWIYRNIFRPASLVITPTDKDGIGHVNGDLKIGGKGYDWLSLPYKDETKTGINASLITWSTTNPYGRQVQMLLYSVPSSDIVITKGVGRIGGTGHETEVYSPVVYYRSRPADSLYRVTVLLSAYPSDVQKVPETVSVNGNGNALKVQASEYEDYVYTGKGVSSFGPYTTDADTAYVRSAGGPFEYTLINGKFLYNSGKPLINITNAVEYLTLKRSGNTISFSVSSDAPVDIGLYDLSPNSSYKVSMDGSSYSKWTKGTGPDMVITAGSGEHSFEIRAGP